MDVKEYARQAWRGRRYVSGCVWTAICGIHAQQNRSPLVTRREILNHAPKRQNHG